MVLEYLLHISWAGVIDANRAHLVLGSGPWRLAQSREWLHPDTVAVPTVGTIKHEV